MKRGLVWLMMTMMPFLAFGQITGGLPERKVGKEVDHAEQAEAALNAIWRPHLYFNNRPDCLVPAPGPPQCHIPPYIHDPSVPNWPNLDPFTPLVELSLPEGNYMVTAKLSAHPWGAWYWFIFECSLYDAAGLFVDYSTFEGWHQTLALQIPVSFKKPGTMTVGCKLTGYTDYPGGDQHVDMRVWNVSIAAIRVGTVTMETGACTDCGYPSCHCSQ